MKLAGISNKTLVILIIIAMVVSLTGTLMSIGKIKSMISITGYAGTSETGTVWLQQVIGREITVRYTLINFSSGGVNTSGGWTWCHIYTNITPTTSYNSPFVYNFSGYKNETECVNFTIPAQGFEIENTGSLTANVTMNSTNTSWLNGVIYPGEYKYKLSHELDTSCAQGNVTTWTNMPSDAPQVCGGLTTNTSKNSFQVAIYVGIPRDLTTGAKTDTVTFTAIAP